MRNQKAGSHFLYNRLAGIFPDLACTRGVEPYLGSSFRNHKSPNFRRVFATDFVFTVVRDPVLTALRAFCEIDLRSQQSVLARYTNVSQHPKYKTVSCHDCPSCRYAAFLDSIAALEPLSHDFFHAYPQTVKTLVHGALDAVFKLEALDAGLAAIASRLGTQLNSTIVTKRDQHSHAVRGCCPRVEADVLALPQVVARMCQMYMADFVCFGYKLPAPCMPSAHPTGS